MIGNLSGY